MSINLEKFKNFLYAKRKIFYAVFIAIALVGAGALLYSQRTIEVVQEPPKLTLWEKITGYFIEESNPADAKQNTAQMKPAKVAPDANTLSKKKQ